MKFFVTGEFVEVGALLPPDQLVALVETTIIPSVEMLAQWERDGRLVGGAIAGSRTGIFIIEASSSEELGEMLSTLPFWGMIKWDVHPLQSAESVVSRERGVVERVRQATSA